MNPSDARARVLRMLGAYLPERIGPEASWRIYDRSLRTPMNVVLEEVDRQLGQECVVIWVDGGFPEVFTVTGLPVVNAVYSTRYLEQSAFVRTLIVESAFGQRRTELAERAALKVMAELLLRRGQPDLACLCFLRSVVGQHWFVGSENLLGDLEMASINESYMAFWFFGLVHELGHSEAAKGDAAGLLGVDQLEQELDLALENFVATIRAPFTAEEALAEVWRDPGHPLAPASLREEVFADLFAAQVLLQSTMDIMRRVGGERFDPAAFIAEMAIYVNVISFLERCKTATVTVTDATAREKQWRALLHPVGYAVRALFLRWYLGSAMEHFYRGDDPESPERAEQWARAVMDVSTSFSDQLNEMESGAARGLEFLFFPDRRGDDDLFRRVADQAADRNAGGAMLTIEIRRFCALARSLHVDGDELDLLANLAHSR